MFPFEILNISKTAVGARGVCESILAWSYVNYHTIRMRLEMAFIR